MLGQEKGKEREGTLNLLIKTRHRKRTSKGRALSSLCLSNERMNERNTYQGIKGTWEMERLARRCQPVVAQLCAIFSSSPIWFAAGLTRHPLIGAKSLFIYSENNANWEPEFAVRSVVVEFLRNIVKKVGTTNRSAVILMECGLHDNANFHGLESMDV